MFIGFAVANDFLSAIILSYAVIAFGSHIGHESFIWDILEGSWSMSISMPGIIFGLNLDGFIFFLLYKMIIAPIISFLIGLVIGIGGTIISIIISMVMFPFNIATFFKEMRY